MSRIAPPPPTKPDADDSSGDGARRWVVMLETWALSLAFHISLIVALGLTWKATTQPAGDAPEILRTVELVAKRESPEGPVYVDRAQAQAEAQAAAAAVNPSPSEIAKVIGGGGAPSPIDVSPALPKAAEIKGLGLGSGPPTLGGPSLLDGPAAKTGTSGGKGRTQVYGLKGEGFKFVYVFDRSGSMGSASNRALNSAKQELLKSIADLGETHQFQIIFYNEQPTIMRFGGSVKLMFADANNKKQARDFVAGITADGATAHEPAIIQALDLAPDVIFFLTDADQPELSPAQLARTEKRNRSHAVINTIEFGLGPKISKENFLDRLAAQNGGGSVYIDISSRGP